MKKITLLILLLMAALLVACTDENTVPEELQAGEITEAATDTKIHEFGVGDEINSTITLGTLELVYEGENEAAASINADLKRMLDEYLTVTVDEDTMFFSEDDTLMFTHERIYELVFMGEGLISIVAHGYDYNAGAAHPYTYRLGYTYDSNTGRRLSLADVLEPGYEELLKESVVSQIAAAGEGASYFPGFEEDIKVVLAEENWYIKDDMINLVFNPYQIAPAALGIVEFSYIYR